MLQYGANITSVDDKLHKVSPERIYQGIRHPKRQLRQQIERLRMVRSVDPRQYARLKKELPYFVCGRFHPPTRRKDHFAAIEHFMIDLDHFDRSELDLAETSERMRADERVLMGFVSPGGDGLKLMFRLEEPCFDSGMYSLFYKAFVQHFAREHQLEAVVDLRTHDVTRACFLSTDPGAWFHPGSTAVVLGQYFDPTAPDAERAIHRAHKKLEAEAPAPAKEAKEPLSDEVLLGIKQKLNPDFRPRRKRQAYVPPELEEVMPRIEARFTELGIILQDVESIHYGKKLRVQAGEHWAEVNIFFGKRGFSVVKTTKSGSRVELAELARQALDELLDPDTS